MTLRAALWSLSVAVLATGSALTGAYASGDAPSAEALTSPGVLAPLAPVELQGSCGDGRCQPPEDCGSCPSDCGSCCGDGRCQPPEDCNSCPGDCGSCCGDGRCQPPEDCNSCPTDCCS